MKHQFKKATSLILCAAMLLGYLLVPGILPKATAEDIVSDNLLENASFETLPTTVKDWGTYTNNTLVTYTDKYVKTGKMAVAFHQAETTAASGINQSVSVTPGAEYTISAYTFVEGSTKIDRRLNYYLFTADGTNVTPSGNHVTIAKDESAGWSELTTTVTIPDNVTKMTINIYATKTCSATIYVDDVSIKAAGSETNLLKNPGFETYVNDIPGWYAGSANATFITSKSVAAAEGTNVLEVTGYNSQILSTQVAAEPGATYTASIKAYGADGAKPQLYIRFLNDAGERTQKSVSTNQTSWDTLSIEYVAPDDAATVQLVLVCKGEETATAWYFDDASLVKKTEDSSGDTGGDSGEDTEPELPLDDKDIVVSDKNLIRNPLFEKTFYEKVIALDPTTAPTGWTISSVTDKLQILKTNESTVAGDWSVKLVDTATNAGIQMYTRVDNIQAGQDYTSYYKRMGEGRPQLIIRFYDESNAMLQEYKYTPECKSNWSASQKTDNTAPEGSSYAIIMLATGGSATCNAYIDDLQFYLTSDTTKTNLLTNPSFEEYPDTLEDIPGTKKNVSTLEGWYNITSSMTLTQTNNQVDRDAVGNYMMKIVDESETGGQQMYYVVDVEPGKYYTFSAMLRGSFSNSAPQLLFQYYQDDACSQPAMITNKNGDLVSSMKTNIAVTEESWTRGTYTVQAPADAKKLRISLNTAKAALGWFYAGSISLVEALDEKFLNLGFDYVEDNGSLTAWLPHADGTFTIETENTFAGDKAIKITDSSAELQQGAIQPLTDLTGYKIASYDVSDMYYTLTARVKDTAGVKGQIAIIYYDNNFTKISETTAVSDGSGKWQLVIAEDKAPALAVYAEIAIRVGENASATGSIIVDDMTFVSYYGQYIDETYDWEIKYDEGNRLYFTEEELADIREYAHDGTVNAFGVSGAAAYIQLIKDADNYLVQTSWTMYWTPEDDRTTNYTVDLVNLPDINKAPELWNKPGGRSWPYLEGISTGIATRMQTLALAYAITGDTRYADRAVEYVERLCEWEYWTETDYVWAGGLNTSLCTPRLVIGVASVYDMCYDYLTAAQRQLISENIIHKGLAPMYLDLTGPKRHLAHNKYMARCSGLMIGALAVINEENYDEVVKYLDRAYEYASWYLDSQYETGDQEGYSYTNVAVDEIMEGMSCMTRITGREGLIDHPYFEEVLIDWVVDFLAPGSNTFPVYSDSYLSGFFPATMLILNKETGNGKAGYYLQKVGLANNPILVLLYTSKTPAITAPTEKDYVAYIGLVGYGGLRTGWTADDQMLYLIGNNSKLNHNQYDQLSFQFAANNSWLAVDPGYDNSEFGDKYGHNTILVDGVAQSIMGEGTLNQVADGKLYGHLMGSAPGAYGEGTLTQFDRHAIMINHGDRPYYIILDELSANNTHFYDWVLNTGGWNTLEVDGNPLGENSQTLGNRITVSGNSGVMYAEFISKNPLNVQTVQRQSEDGTNNLLQINCGATLRTQYMTIINKAFGDSGDDEYSFVPLLNTPEAVNYVTSSTDSTIVKSVGVKGVPLYFFRGHKAGDWIEWPFVAAESGTFELVLKTAKSYNYGIYKIYIDGEYVATYDGYGERVELNYFSLGQREITAGDHTLKLELIGTSSLVSGMLISMSSIIFKTGETKLDPSPIYTQEVYDTDKVLGAKIYHNAANHDIVLYNRTTGSISAGGVTTDAQQATIIGLMADGYMEGFAAINATSLALNGTTLMKASGGATVSADYRGKTSFIVTTEKDQTIYLYALKDILGAAVNGQSVDFTISDGMAAIYLKAGTYTVDLKVSESVEYTYTEDGGKGITLFNENGEITYKHVTDGEGTVYLYENGKVIINVYINPQNKLKIREELAEDGTLTITYYDLLDAVTKIEVNHPNGNLTTIKYNTDGSVSTTVTDSRGNTLEMVMEMADGRVTKAQYLSDRTITTKTDKDGKVSSITTIYKEGGKRVEEIYAADGTLRSVTTQSKGGAREEVVYNEDGSEVTTTYVGGKLKSVYIKNADGTAELVEHLDDGSTCTTKYDANGNVIGGSEDNNWLWIVIAVAAVVVVCGVVAMICLKNKKKNNARTENE